MSSPYSRVGAKLVDQGYSAIPVFPGSKRPGAWSRGWHGDLDWTRFCERLPTNIETEIWSKWPDAGVCVALGGKHGLVAVDIDTEDHEIIAAVEAVLPEPSPVQKRGRKGYTSFYCAGPSVVSTAFNVAGGGRALDLLARGKTTVIPPTIHPDSGRPYEWATEATLEDTSPGLLPVLPDDIAARLGEALRPFGHISPVERPASGSDGGIWREINDTALRRFGDWLPYLGLDAKQQHDGRWRGRAVWKDAENSNVGFDINGIRDWGENRGMTAIDVVMAASHCDFATAEKWLREKLGLQEPPRVRIVFRKPSNTVFVEPAVQPIPFFETKVDPFDHEVAGGLLQKTAEWIMSISFRPSRELSLLAAIGYMAAFIGRRYIGPTSLSPNLYLIGLMGTGGGKDAPLEAVNSLATRGGMPHLLGAGDIGSSSAIERIVRDKPSCISTIDEIGMLVQGMSARNASAWVKDIHKSMLTLYGKSKVGSIWMGRDLAGSEKLSSKNPIYSPCFSILGMSTPETFFKGLTEDNASDGLLNRLTVIHIPPAKRVQRIPVTADIPMALTGAYSDALKVWLERCEPPGRFEQAYLKSDTDPYLHPVPWENTEAERRWRSVLEWQDATAEDSANDHIAGVVMRTAEQAIKLAMIRAVSRDFAAPAVTVEDVWFGEAIAQSSVRMLTTGMRKFMAGSEFEDHCKTLLRAVDAAPKGLPYTMLTRAKGVGKIESKRLAGVIEYLTNTGRWRAEKTGTRGFRYFSVGDLIPDDPEEEAAAGTVDTP